MAKNGNGKSSPAPATKKMTKAEIDGLFAKIAAAENKVEAANNAVAMAVAERSEAVLAVKNACGSGPFNVKGRGLVTIRSRAQKVEQENADGTTEMVETGKYTHFLVGQGDSDGIINVG